jgi:hypothetical protein
MERDSAYFVSKLQAHHISGAAVLLSKNKIVNFA